MLTSKKILGVVIGAFIALAIAMGASGSTATTVPAPTFDPADTVAACGKCGDNYCNPRCGETATSCPRDCGGGGPTTVASNACGKCGDGYCNPRCGETATSCPRDCGGATAATETDDCSSL